VLYYVLLNVSTILVIKDEYKLLMGRPMTELRDVTCHVESHSFACHPTHVNVPRLNPSQ